MICPSSTCHLIKVGKSEVEEMALLENMNAALTCDVHV